MSAEAPAAKRARVGVEEEPSGTEAEEDGFRGVAASSSTSSSSSLSSSSSSPSAPPLLPRDYKHLLLDIEGCTTSIAFVHDELFPFARKQLAAFTAALPEESRRTHEEALRADVAKLDPEMCAKAFPQIAAAATTVASLSLEECVTGLMDHDVKAAGLKALQGTHKRYEQSYYNNPEKLSASTAAARTKVVAARAALAAAA